MSRADVYYLTWLPVLLLVVAPVQAQPGGASNLSVGSHQVLIGLALEPEPVANLGYSYAMGPQNLHAGIRLGAGIKLPTTALTRGARRMHLATSGHWLADGRWGAAVTSLAYLARNVNRAGTMHGLGLELRAAPGYHGSRWGAALDVGWQSTLLTHVRHSADSRAAFDDRHPARVDGGPGPRDGWYGSTAHRVRLGITGTRALTGGVRLQIAAGSLFALQKQGILFSFDLGQVSLYLETTLHAGW